MNPTLLTLARFTALACALGATSALLGRIWPGAWLPGLASHWQWLYLVLGTVASVVWFATGRRWVTAVPLAVTAVCFALVSPAAERQAAAGPTLSIASANLRLDNPSLDRLQAWLLGDDRPDVVFLQEFTPRAEVLVNSPAVRVAYPHRLLAADTSPFGIAILSRRPLSDKSLVQPPGGPHTPRLHARIDWQGRPVRLTAMHPMPPLDGHYATARDTALREEAVRLTEGGGLGILAGDLNDTPWSTGLRGVGDQLFRATGLAPTWPNAFGVLSVLPLDHVLVTAGWRTVSSRVGPDLGSDHRPVVVVLAAP